MSCLFYLREGVAEREPAAQSDHASQLLLSCQSRVERKCSTLKKQTKHVWWKNHGTYLLCLLLTDKKHKRNSIVTAKNSANFRILICEKKGLSFFCDFTNCRFVHLQLSVQFEWSIAVNRCAELKLHKTDMDSRSVESQITTSFHISTDPLIFTESSGDYMPVIFFHTGVSTSCLATAQSKEIVPHIIHYRCQIVIFTLLFVRIKQTRNNMLVCKL